MEVKRIPAPLPWKETDIEGGKGGGGELEKEKGNYGQSGGETPTRQTARGQPRRRGAHVLCAGHVPIGHVYFSQAAPIISQASYSK